MIVPNRHAFAPETTFLLMAANDNLPKARMSAVLTEALLERPNAIEAAVIREWSERDPLDAAMAAYSLQRRLRFGDDVVDQGAPKRPEVEAVIDQWRRHYVPQVYLPAADRLHDVLSRWADEEITPSLISNP